VQRVSKKEGISRMTGDKWKRESLKLTAEEWAALERIAAQVSATATTGPTAGEPSWRRMLKEIATGELTVTRKDATMLLSEYFQQNADTIYRYVGEIWGTDEFEETGARLAEMIAENPDMDGEIGNHPTNELFGDEDGRFYIQSWDIWYASSNNLIQEFVFEEVE